jgi:mannan polymerase II complex ANP1 subunit
MELDGVGGVSILAKARVFRAGVHFPAFSFEKHAETEGFGKMAKRMKFSVYGLPHYTVWHLYEPSVDDLKHMEEMEAEKKAREAQEKITQEQVKKAKSDFEDVDEQWAKDKEGMAGAAAAEKQNTEATGDAKGYILAKDPKEDN